MKLRAWLQAPGCALCLLIFLVPTNPETSISYFKYVTDINISQPERQNYFVVSPDIWDNARQDLGDLRLFDGDQQVPYALREQRGGVSIQERPARILNLGTAGGKTEFVVDVGEVPEYDQIRLQLDTRNFVTPSEVFGESQLDRGPVTQLGSSTLYDFSREGLGSNFVLKLPPSSFRFLHVRLGGGVRPADVKGATVSNVQETKTAWMGVGAKPTITEDGKNTVVTWKMSEHVPLERVAFILPDVVMTPAGNVNFRRTVTLRSPGEKPGTDLFWKSGTISYVRMTRDGNTVDSRSLDLDVPSVHAKKYVLTIENGDDPPLKLEAVEPLSIERRVYFDPKGKASLRLYYGDEKLAAPVYDYDKFFQESAHPSLAQLGPIRVNSQFAGRPDDRPWSERHQAVMWIAMLAAIVGLALVAVRGMKSVPTTPRT
jgi:hypothetical protein